ncbi:unnamed protein product, partial [Cladocopium goreaui]
MEDASEDVTSELLDALLSGWAAGGHVRECLTEDHMKIRLGRGFEPGNSHSPTVTSLAPHLRDKFQEVGGHRELASTWRHAQTPKLLAAVCGLRSLGACQASLFHEGFHLSQKKMSCSVVQRLGLGVLVSALASGYVECIASGYASCIASGSTVLALQVALAKLLDSAVKPGAQGPSPLLGTLQTLPPQGARQVMTRISKLYSVVVGMLVSAESKCLGDPLLELLAQLQLISGTPLRSLRQAASAAALGALQALLAERHVARGALAELETQKRALMDAAGDAAAAARLARLCRGTAQLEALTQQMDVEVGKMQERVLLPRLQDTAAILRRFTLNALGRYMQLKFLWTPERILQGFFDPAPEVRLQAIEIAGAWFEGDLDDSALVREAASHLAERSRDSEPRVSAAAHPVLVSQLSDDDFARVANLALTAPDSHGLLRVEAALFVEQHLLPEPGLGIAAKKQPGEEGDDLERHFITEHGLMAVADFLTSYLPENDQLHLSRRFVEALWLRTDAFRRWSALADLCLLGEGQGAARGVPCLPNRQRLALLVVLDAALKCAEVPGDATEALLPRLPRLFELFTAEGLCFLDVLASISRRLICAACQKDEALPRALLVALLSALRTRRSGVHAMLQLAEALVAWAERSSEVQTATRQLVLDLYSSLSLQLSSPTSELSQVLGPLLALGHRGVDLW